MRVCSTLTFLFQVLPCLHSFCEQCLSDVIPAESLSVTCPVCRQQSILPLDGVPALQNNVFILNLLNSLKLPDYCNSCSEYHHRYFYSLYLAQRMCESFEWRFFLNSFIIILSPFPKKSFARIITVHVLNLIFIYPLPPI